MQSLTKRQHALHELLSSERAYASDLTLIRDFHIPLAQGHTPSLNIPPAKRTLSTASDESTASSSSSSGSNGPPPMTPEDVKTIFGNITELAAFSDMFTEELERALGANIDGGHGDDSVGELFLRIIPQLEKPFKQYITRHSTALSHLTNLPSTPELQHYLAYTQEVAKALSHAWDLASLLIKPVQRLLKYPLLLNAIIEETPDAHPDKDNLRLARTRMEEVARNVNEGRRRAEVIRDVLTGGKGVKKTTKEVSVTIAAGVGLSKVKSLRHGGVTVATMKADLAAAAAAANGDDPMGIGGGTTSNGVGGAAGSAAAAAAAAAAGGVNHPGSEAVKVGLMQDELKRIEVFAQQFAKNTVEYSKSMFNLMHALRQWAISFGRVIGLTPDQGSEAFEAFMDVIGQHLMPLAVDLEGVITEKILKEMAYLLGTLTQPLKLLASMNEQEPFHYHLLTMPISAKNKPPPSLLAASQNYLALRGQLAAELPDYIRLLHHGLAVIVRRLGEIQRRFWRDVRDRWGSLWEMLRVEGEMNAGSEETVGVWGLRFREVEEIVQALRIVQPQIFSPSPPQQSTGGILSGSASGKSRRGSVDYFPSPAPSFQGHGPGTPQIASPTAGGGNRLEKRHSQKKSNASSSNTTSSPPPPNVSTVQAMFAALEPAHSPRIQQQQQQQQSSPYQAHAHTPPMTPPTLKPPPAPINVAHAQNAFGMERSGSNSVLGSAISLAGPGSNSAMQSSAVGASPSPSLASGLLYGGGVGVVGAGMGGMLPGMGEERGIPAGARRGHHRRGSSHDSSNAMMHALSGASVPNSVNTTGSPRRRDSIKDRAGGQGQSQARRRTTAGFVDEGEFYTGGGLSSSLRGDEFGGYGGGMSMTPAQQYAYMQAHGVHQQQQYHHHSHSHSHSHPQPPYSASSHHTSSQHNTPPSHHAPSSPKASPSTSTATKPAIPRTKSMPLANQLNGGTARYIPPHAVLVSPRDLERLPMAEGGEYVVDPSGHVYFVPNVGPGMKGIGDEVFEDEKERERKAKNERGRERGSKSGATTTTMTMTPTVQPVPARNSFGAKSLTSSTGPGGLSSPQREREKDNSSPKAKSKERRVDHSPGKDKSSVLGAEKEREKDKVETKERPGHARKRSGSVKSITSFFMGNSTKDDESSLFDPSSTPPLPSANTPPSSGASPSHRDSWVSKPAKYLCQVIHPCKPPAAVSYYSFPFFTLLEGELFEVLQEAGHPSIHPKLPLYVDDGEDCLLLVRDGRGTVGWALASFLEPVGFDFNVGGRR